MKHRILLLFALCCFTTGFAQIDTSKTPVPHSFEEIPTVDTIYILEPHVAQADMPLSFQNIMKERIEQQNFGQEPSFILSRTPSMTAYSDAGSYQGYSYFRLRGIDQTRINMSLDGVPLNEPEDQGVYFSNYPDFFNSLHDLQIQRGVGTTKFGTASFGGSMDFFCCQSLGFCRRRNRVGVAALSGLTVAMPKRVREKKTASALMFGGVICIRTAINTAPRTLPIPFSHLPGNSGKNNHSG